MKKFRFFSFASAMLLASAAGMVSCSSDSIEPTGGPGATGQVVKTQFAINIPYGGNSSTNQAKKVTRMTDEMTQQSNNFRGISDIVLLTFNGNPSTAGNTEATRIIEIGTDANAYAQEENRKLYRDIEIPVGTNHMLFYGRATRKSGDTDFKAGKITNVGTKTTEKVLANISHELTPINSTANFTTDTEAGKIIDALNAIAKATVTDGTDGKDYTWATIETETTLPTWLTENEKKFLAARYKEFISLKAGSRTSVVEFIKNLQTALVGETGGTTIHAEKKLTKEIYDKCVAALGAIESINFPGKFNLPDGAASLNWTSGGFAYNTPENVTIGTGNSINYQKICYPAELSYFVNTTTMVSDKDMSNLNDFPAYNDWTNPNGANWEGKNFSEDAVANTTKTVGLKAPVQYSVAVLKSTVRCNAATLKDNAKQAGGFDKDQLISVPADGFKVTGILIGGQPASVNWKYDPSSTESFANTIYDKEMNGSMAAKNETSASNANYTLVFDNKKSDAQSPVYVTLELENNSDKAFYGKDGIILKGAKFYLVGQLNPNKTGLTNPNSVNRVFMQDYVTTANFNIKELKSAYNCIPDLRTSGINVGLAVDLSWKTGITFDVEI